MAGGFASVAQARPVSQESAELWVFTTSGAWPARWRRSARNPATVLNSIGSGITGTPKRAASVVMRACAGQATLTS
jgi:hypothetical protein